MVSECYEFRVMSVAGTTHHLLPILLPAFLSFFFSASCAALVSKFGPGIALIDNPNGRSSHSLPTPRGGGIGIWIGFLILGVFIIKDISFTLIAGTAGLIGFLEDLFTLSSRLRLGIQFIISALVAGLFLMMPLSISAVALFGFWVVFIAGTTNFYNFMDGINGIAGLTGLIGFALMAYFAYFMLNDYDLFLMSIILVTGCLGFLPFNFPRARVFMGDVGSIFLGFVFASFVVMFSVTISIFLCLVMFLCTFYADAIVTIYYRWKRGENMMQAHRSHLYQYMSNELGMPHWQVSLIYAVIQLWFGVFAILAYQNGLTLQIGVLVAFSILFVMSYSRIKKIKPKMALQ